jgi:hypothetical protein
LILVVRVVPRGRKRRCAGRALAPTLAGACICTMGYLARRP